MTFSIGMLYHYHWIPIDDSEVIGITEAETFLGQTFHFQERPSLFKRLTLTHKLQSKNRAESTDF